MNKTRNIKYIKAFGENLRKIRQKKQLTMLNLAFEADIEYSQIAKIERGLSNPTISIAYALANALNVKVTELFSFPNP
ncbi:MAG: helix-turn-helix transcriptional regulator [Ferruginibacter sp.]|nr:helix-turn-helix transcriptional regulator [Ferruginibacter sp.]